MHAKAYTIFMVLLLGGCAFTTPVPEIPLATSVPAKSTKAACTRQALIHLWGAILAVAA